MNDVLKAYGVLGNPQPYCTSFTRGTPALGFVGINSTAFSRINWLTAFGKRVSEEFASRGVRVNTVSPGVVGTSLWRDPEGFGGRVAAANGLSHQDFLAAIPAQAGIASGRMTEPEEVAALLTFLASKAAANVVGSDVVIDGGMSNL